MDKNFISRRQEIRLLQAIKDSGEAEFVAVYGRRRVGKTYLIQQFFDNKFAFSALRLSVQVARVLHSHC